MAGSGTKRLTLPKALDLPEFVSEEEEREWWARHDTSELPGQDVRFTLAGSEGPAPRALPVRKDQLTVNHLKRPAAERKRTR